MIDFTFAPSHPFLVGTVVSAYLDEGQAPQGPPQGTVVGTATVQTDGALTFTGLTEDTAYYAVAQVGSDWRWVGFRTELPPPPNYKGDKGDAGATGATGAQGPAGSALGVDVFSRGGSESAAAAITDWGPIVNNLIANGAPGLSFEKRSSGLPVQNGAFPFTTPITALSHTHLPQKWQGVAGRVLTNQGDKAGAYLLWKGAGSGLAIDPYANTGFTIENMGVLYDNPSYTGQLIGPSTGNTMFRGAHFGSDSPATIRGAECLINMSGVNPKLFDCTLSGAQKAVRFQYGADPEGIPNAAVIEQCWFDNCDDMFLCNPAFLLSLVNNIFEFGSLSASPTPVGIGADHATARPSVIFADRNEYWDFTGGGGQYAYDQPANCDWRVYSRNEFFNGQGAGRLLGPGVADFEGAWSDGNFTSQPFLTVGDAVADPTVAKLRLRLVRAYLPFVGVPITNWDKGHANPWISEIEALSGSGQDVRPISQVYAVGGAPSIVKHSGSAASSVALGIGAKDFAGEVAIVAPGSPLAAGIHADVTFSRAMRRNFTGTSPTYAVPVIVVSSYQRQDDSSPVNHPEAYAILGTNQQDGFQLATKGTIPAGETASYSYVMVGR